MNTQINSKRTSWGHNCEQSLRTIVQILTSKRTEIPRGVPLKDEAISKSLNTHTDKAFTIFTTSRKISDQYRETLSKLLAQGKKI